MQSNATRTTNRAVSFLAWVAFFQAMGGLMGLITSQDLDSWYRGLEKSQLNPPDPVFGITWTLLYFLLSISFWLLWLRRNLPGTRTVLLLFGGHMILNWIWTPAFFTFHLLAGSFYLILALIVTAAIVARKAYFVDKRAAWMFAPYIAWLCFAAHLSFYIWQNN